MDCFPTWDGPDNLRGVPQAHKGELVKPPGANVPDLHWAPFPLVHNLLPGVAIWRGERRVRMTRREERREDGWREERRGEVWRNVCPLLSNITWSKATCYGGVQYKNETITRSNSMHQLKPTKSAGLPAVSWKSDYITGSCTTCWQNIQSICGETTRFFCNTEPTSKQNILNWSMAGYELDFKSFH